MTSVNVSSAAPPARVPMAAISSGVTVILLGISAVSIALAGAHTFAISDRQTSTLIIGMFVVSIVPSLVLTLVYHQPLMFGWHLSGFLFVVSVAGIYSYSEVAGALLVAGLLIGLVGLTGLSGRLADVMPTAIVFGALSGIIMPLVVGMLVAGFQGKLGAAEDWSLPSLTLITPAFGWQAIFSISPVIVGLVTVNTNLAGIIYLRSEGYDPPERVIQFTSGIGTMAGSLIGAVPVSIGTLILPLVAGPEAGERERRLWAIYITAAGFTVIALLAGIAAQLPNMIPTSLLLAIAGLGLLPVLGQVLAEVTKGPLRLGPLFAFVVASSRLSLGGFGPSFWALVIGVGVTLLLENDQLRALRVAAAHSGA